MAAGIMVEVMTVVEETSKVKGSPVPFVKNDYDLRWFLHAVDFCIDDFLAESTVCLILSSTVKPDLHEYMFSLIPVTSREAFCRNNCRIIKGSSKDLNCHQNPELKRVVSNRKSCHF